MSERPFKVLGIQQVAKGGLDKGRLRALWVDSLGLAVTGNYRSERENVDEDSNGQSPVSGEGVLIELVQAPPEVIAAYLNFRMG